MKILTISIDDEDIANVCDNRLQDVGTIRVEISRVKLGKKMRFEGYEAENLGYVHERAKKAGAHCTRSRLCKSKAIEGTNDLAGSAKKSGKKRGLLL